MGAPRATSADVASVLVVSVVRAAGVVSPQDDGGQCFALLECGGEQVWSRGVALRKPCWRETFLFVGDEPVTVYLLNSQPTQDALLGKVVVADPRGGWFSVEACADADVAHLAATQNRKVVGRAPAADLGQLRLEMDRVNLEDLPRDASQRRGFLWGLFLCFLLALLAFVCWPRFPKWQIAAQNLERWRLFRHSGVAVDVRVNLEQHNWLPLAVNRDAPFVVACDGAHLGAGVIRATKLQRGANTISMALDVEARGAMLRKLAAEVLRSRGAFLDLDVVARVPATVCGLFTLEVVVRCVQRVRTTLPLPRIVLSECSYSLFDGVAQLDWLSFRHAWFDQPMKTQDRAAARATRLAGRRSAGGPS